MVTSTNTERTERAQLVLIGAISIAFILLGVVVVFNSVQYTETVNNGEAGDDLADVRIVESELKTGVEDLNGSININNSMLGSYINGSYQNSTAHSKPISVRYINGSTVDLSDSSAFNVSIKTSDMSTTQTIEVDHP